MDADPCAATSANVTVKATRTTPSNRKRTTAAYLISPTTIVQKFPSDFLWACRSGNISNVQIDGGRNFASRTDHSGSSGNVFDQYPST